MVLEDTLSKELLITTTRIDESLRRVERRVEIIEKRLQSIEEQRNQIIGGWVVLGIVGSFVLFLLSNLGKIIAYIKGIPT